MSKHLQNELEQLKNKLLGLGQMVETSVEKSIQSLKNQDIELAEKVIEADHEIDMKEIEVEEDCLKILALYQPVAIDLRFLVATLKINNDLERIADLSANIAKRAKYLSKKPPMEIPFNFDNMAGKTRTMLKDSLKSLVQMNTKLAEEVCLADKEVDEMNRQVYKKVYSDVKSSPDRAKELFHYLSVSKHLERIADYATNISEDIIYMVEGTIVRHSPEDYTLD